MGVPEHGVTDPIVWVDCEMTGLNLSADALIEIAVVVTDSQLGRLGEGVDITIRPPAAALDQMTDVVRRMHTKSGLLDLLEGGVTLSQAQDLVMDYVLAYVPGAGKAPLAGNSVSTDRGFIDRDLPRLGRHLHYRTIDVSSIKELARRWYPRVYFAAPEKQGGHRALNDIFDSIDELRYYRAALFDRDLILDSEAAKAVAAEIVATSVRT